MKHYLRGYAILLAVLDLLWSLDHAGRFFHALFQSIGFDLIFTVILFSVLFYLGAKTATK